MRSKVGSRGVGVGVGVVAVMLIAADCGGGSGTSSNGTRLRLGQVTMFNHARERSFIMVGVWDHLKDHCMTAYGPPQPSNPYKSPEMTRRQSRQVGHCIDQLYRWLGVKQAVKNYAQTMHLLHEGVKGQCSTRLEATSKSLTAFAVVLDQANKDLAAHGIGAKRQEGNSEKFNQAEAAFGAAEKAMIAACHVTP